MIKQIFALFIVGLVSFFAGKIYMQKSYEISNAVDARKEFFSNAVDSMTMLEFIKKDIKHAEELHLSQLRSFFKDKTSVFPIFTPNDDKEKQAYELLENRVINYQKIYCKEPCI